MVDRLRVFVQDIDSLPEGDVPHQERMRAIDELIAVEPVMRELMNAAQPGLGDYPKPQACSGVIQFDETEMAHGETRYWTTHPRRRALQAVGILTFGEEARRKMRPDGPDLVADQFHPWAWEAAAPLWFAGSRQEAVNAAARSVNARLQQKLGRHDSSESGLVREAFSLDAPVAGRPRLRFPGDRTSDTWRSRQQGGMQLGAGCFTGIRNPAAHEDGLVLTEQVALEQLAAFSLLARWLDECEVETAQ
jgi:hypothetical protein